MDQYGCVTAHALSRMIGIAYDKANSPRYKTAKWISIAQTLETCHQAEVNGWRRRLPRAVEKWLKGMAKYMGVPA